MLIIMKKPAALISTKGSTKEQLKKEAKRHLRQNGVLAQNKQQKRPEKKLSTEPPLIRPDQPMKWKAAITAMIAVPTIQT